MFVPLVTKLCSSLPQHRFERLVKLLNHSVTFWVVRSCVQLFYAEQVADVEHQVRQEVVATI